MSLEISQTGWTRTRYKVFEQSDGSLAHTRLLASNTSVCEESKCLKSVFPSVPQMADDGVAAKLQISPSSFRGLDRVARPALESVGGLNDSVPSGIFQGHRL